MDAATSERTESKWSPAEPKASFHGNAAVEAIDTASEKTAVPSQGETETTEGGTPPAKSAFERTEALTESDIRAMHALFCKYYENTDLETFTRDLSKKDGAVILRETQSGRIRGFSTVMMMKIRHAKGEAVGFFSGDTIVDKVYWGGSHMRFTFLRFLIQQKLRYFGRPIYWFLISKGYKTYLLLANNCEHYYPRYDQPDDPFLKSLAVAYSKRLYPEQFREDLGILEMGDGAQHLKGEVAPITQEMREKYPKIRFFDDRNPNWRRGDELPCVGEVTIPLILKVGFKFLSRMGRK